MDSKVIRARREAILAEAPCEGCGVSEAACASQRGKDPTAPPWFGCCARGLGMDPCNHVPSWRALITLLKEIEGGRVADTEDVLLASIEESPIRGRRGLARAVAWEVFNDWPDDVPLPGHF